VKVAQMNQLARFPRRITRTGVGPSPNLATSSPPTMKATLMNPQRKPQASTETSESP
jgi:hypothetical protein